MKDALNNGLIKAMREHLPEETNLANYIMDIISIGKEAVYRRLRGEVPFTFYEVSLLSQSLGISLDQIVGTNRAEGAVFNLNVADAPVISITTMISSNVTLSYSLLLRMIRKRWSVQLAILFLIHFIRLSSE